MKVFEIEDHKLDAIITIKVGENAQENWKLISDAKQYHLWFHLDNVTSPHVILELPSKTDKISKSTILYAASICKNCSKYHNNKINISYTQIKNVKKGDKIGSVYTSNTQKIKL